MKGAASPAGPSRSAARHGSSTPTLHATDSEGTCEYRLEAIAAGGCRRTDRQIGEGKCRNRLKSAQLRRVQPSSPQVNRLPLVRQ